MRICWADTETASTENLKTAGSFRYAEHASTKVQLFSYTFDNDPEVGVWDIERQEPMPSDLKYAIDDPGTLFYFHNVIFDRAVLRHALNINLPIDRTRCVMAMALSHGLPASLDSLGDALGLPGDARKMKEGKQLMALFCKPNSKGEWITYKTHPEEWERYKEYCRIDTIAMRECAKRIPRWNYPHLQDELQYWCMDQRMNIRGMQVDLGLVDAAIRNVDREKTLLAKRTKEITQEVVSSVTQRDVLLNYIVGRFDVPLEDIRKATLEKLLKDEDLPDELRELVLIRLSTSKTSTAKYKRLKGAVCKDGRFRGGIQYCGASRTGRDSGKLVQIQNFPSRGLLSNKETELGIRAMKADMAHELGFDVAHLASSALRHNIIAKPGCKLVVADLSAIEGRVLAYLANEEWKVQAYRDSDADPSAPDLYRLSYAKSFQIDPHDVTDYQRQVGKVQELALGYGGSVGAFITFSIAYNINLDDLANKVLPVVDTNVLEKSQARFDDIQKRDKERCVKKGIDYTQEKTFGLKRDTFAAILSLVRLWRLAQPATVQFWYDTHDAVTQAIAEPNRKFEFGNGLYAIRNGVWVRIVLPSGRSLCYPRMCEKEYRDEDDDKLRTGLTFKGTKPVSRQWGWIRTSGQKLVENCFTSDTLVLTQRGAVPIVDIDSSDRVWDGINWVTHDGVINQGRQEVGEWLGIRVTKYHKIFDGNRYHQVGKISADITDTVLRSARDSVVLQLLRQEIEKNTVIYLGTKIDQQNGLWRNTMKVENVYDLLNCGINNRFTILTPYGPVIVHNCVQGLSRDIFKYGQLNCEYAGYPSIFAVHDELVAEVLDVEKHNVKEVERIMAQSPPWALDLPLAAKGFEDYRYHK